MMNNKDLSTAQAHLKLALWNAEANSTKSSDVYARLQELGLPEEVASRLYELVTFTREVSGKAFAIGKIVLLKILEFVKAHPFLVAGIGVCGVISTAIVGLVASIPFLGPILAPVATVLGMTVTAIGAVIGHKIDKHFNGVGEDIFEIAKSFFALFSNVINVVFCNVATA